MSEAPAPGFEPRPLPRVLTARGRPKRLTQRLLATLDTQPRWWLLAVVSTGLGALALLVLIAYTLLAGIGVWGNNIPVTWAWGITNFVWWIGIGHAGTFISAVLLLTGSHWRTSINRMAEAMTLFAVLNAALFPLIHMGRPWFGFWLAPLPDTLGLWPNFRSALPWDMAAVATYATISLLFFYLGLLPDLAKVRDRSRSRLAARIYGLAAMGWRGTLRQWKSLRVSYALLAGLATPLVISVHTVVSFDFAITKVPGWHATVFPPFFVVGAVYSGFAMLVLLLLPIRRLWKLTDIITARHVDNLGKALLASACFMAIFYFVEYYSAYTHGGGAERNLLFSFRPTRPMFWVMVTGNVLLPQLLWVRSLRTRPWVLALVAVGVQAGMWAERFVIIVMSQARDFLPAAWGTFRASWVDVSIFAGTLSLFAVLYLLFVRFVPMVPISEVAELHQLEREDAG